MWFLSRCVVFAEHISVLYPIGDDNQTMHQARTIDESSVIRTLRLTVTQVHWVAVLTYHSCHHSHHSILVCDRDVSQRRPRPH